MFGNKDIIEFQSKLGHDQGIFLLRSKYALHKICVEVVITKT